MAMISYKKYKKAIRIINKLLHYGFDTYIVGGFVRDYIMEKVSYDIDICTKATPDELMIIFPQTKYGFGTSFKVSIIDGFEVATFRKDKYYNDGNSKNCVITYADTIEEDLSRRDFTMNAIAMDIFNKIYIDPFNGINDIKNKIIRFVGNPKDRIEEDFNRIVRGIRICAKIEGTIEDKSLEAMKIKSNTELKTFVNMVPTNRLMLEIKKTMETCKKASIFFRLIKEVGLHSIILPSLYEGIKVDGGRYHNETIFDHCMYTGDHISIKRPLTKLAGYLHDIGKPMSIEIDKEGNVSFKGHEKIGSELTAIDLNNLTFSNRDIEIISKLVRYHMRPMESPKSIRRILSAFKEHKLCWIDYMRIKIADRHGNTRKPDFESKEIRTRINRFVNETLKEIPLDIKRLKVDGHDVMTIYNIKPSKAVGLILISLFEKVTNEEIQNERELLITFMKNDALKKETN